MENYKEKYLKYKYKYLSLKGGSQTTSGVSKPGKVPRSNDVYLIAVKYYEIPTQVWTSSTYIEPDFEIEQYWEFYFSDLSKLFFQTKIFPDGTYYNEIASSNFKQDAFTSEQLQKEIRNQITNKLEQPIKYLGREKTPQEGYDETYSFENNKENLYINISYRGRNQNEENEEWVEYDSDEYFGYYDPRYYDPRNYATGDIDIPLESEIKKIQIIRKVKGIQNYLIEELIRIVINDNSLNINDELNKIANSIEPLNYEYNLIINQDDDISKKQIIIEEIILLLKKKHLLVTEQFTENDSKKLISLIDTEIKHFEIVNTVKENQNNILDKLIGLNKLIGIDSNDNLSNILNEFKEIDTLTSSINNEFNLILSKHSDILSKQIIIEEIILLLKKKHQNVNQPFTDIDSDKLKFLIDSIN